MKSHFDNLQQVNDLREIKALQRLYPHPHIIQLIEILYDEPTGRLALVFELMEMNLYESIKGRPNYLPELRVKTQMFQLLKAIDHMHRNGIFHRDIKPENILISGENIKLADLGSCRGLYQEPPLTEYISTRWYRAPECLLTDGFYGYKMDIWGVGCVMYEMLSLCPLFPGEDELDQINKIHRILGTPNDHILEYFRKHATHMEINFKPQKYTGFGHMVPHVSPDAVDIINKMLIYDKDERWTASQLIKHPYFKELKEAEQQPVALQFTAGPQGFGRSISSNLAENLSMYSRKHSDNASDVDSGSNFGGLAVAQ
jgi:renal tumor antigen